MSEVTAQVQGVCLVAGGGSGVGEAVVYTLLDPAVRSRLAHPIGHIVIAGRTQTGLLRVQAAAREHAGIDPEIHVQQADLGDKSQVECLFDAIEKIGPLASTVITVGMGADRAEDTSNARLQEVIRANFFAPLFLTEQSVVRFRNGAGCGDIVHVGTLSEKVADVGCDLYTATKAAGAIYASQKGRQEAQARDGARSIRIHRVVPGQIATPMDQREQGRQPGEQERLVASGEMLTPEDVPAR